MLAILLKATVILALGLFFRRMARGGQASVRHAWLATTLAGLAVLPVLALVLPTVTIAVPSGAPAATAIGLALPAPGVATVAAVVSAGRDTFRFTGEKTTASVTVLRAVGWTWAAGFVALLGAMLVSLSRARRMRRTGVPLRSLDARVQHLAARAGIRRHVDILQHEDVAAPLTCGLFRPAIVLPCDASAWDDAELHRALVHELEHVRRGDWAVQIAARVVCAGYWFHPLAWTVFRELRLEAECACDDAAIRGSDSADYADQLVLLAQRLSHAQHIAMVGMASRSNLSARVRAILDERRRRGPATTLAMTTTIVVTAVAVLTIAPMSAMAATDHAVSSAPPHPAQPAKLAQRFRQIVRQFGPLDRAIYEAARQGDVATIDQLLRIGANANAVLPGDGSPLIAAARRNYVAAAKRLLDGGADPDMAVPGDGSPLIAAARSGALDVVTLLLDHGASVDAVVPGDENPLIQASGAGRLEVVELLISRGADVNTRVWVDDSFRSRKGEWRTPLSMALQGRHADVVAILQAAGAR